MTVCSCSSRSTAAAYPGRASRACVPCAGRTPRPWVIAPHSVNTDIAAGRPDASDRAKIAEFCTQLKSRITADAPAGITVPGNPNYRAYNGLPLKPTGGLRCIRCGLCADNCPAGAIPKDAPQKVDKAKCISCLRCIQICPQSPKFYL